MKILHTADWHAGKTLRGQDRTPEIKQALQEVAALATEEQVDLILVAGDLFDKKNPGADAEEAVYNFFLSTAKAGIPSVVIAGNHDAPGRLDAVSGVLNLADTRVIGEARVKQQGGAFSLQVGAEVAQVAALPFVSERRIVRYADLLGADAGGWSEKYREGMRKLIVNLTQDFRDDSVNLLMLHTAMDGATLSNSEYTFHCTESYTLSADMLPDNASYVALGHIHKPQTIQNYPEYLGRYSGSLLQLDFGEANTDKYVYIVNARAGKPTELIKEHRITSGKRLQNVRIDGDNNGELDKKLLDLQAFQGWIKLTVSLSKPRPGLKDRIRAALPNVLAVDFVFPEQQRPQGESVDVDKLNLLESYERFYQETRGQDPDDDLKTAFQTLLEQHTDEQNLTGDA